MSLLDFSERRKEKLASYPAVETEGLCVGDAYEIIGDQLGCLRQNTSVGFWTFGRYAMHQVLRYLLEQTGPADVMACTWAISTRAVEDLLNLRKRGLLRSFGIWVDPRIKVRNPEPLQMLQLNWPVTIAPVHAKVTTIENESWKVTVFGSLNFTTNPQPERGEVCTIPKVFEVDKEILRKQIYGNK